MLLASGFSGRASITVATRTPAGELDDRRFPFAVVRRPGAPALWKLVSTADVVHVAGPALLPMLMARLMGKPLVVEHHGYQAVCPNGLLWLQPAGAVCPGHYAAGRYSRCVACRRVETGLLGALRSVLLTWPRRALARRALANLAVSAHVAARLDLPHTSVIRHGVPCPEPVGSGISPADVATFGYVGRLVREKGLPVLLDAAAGLAREGHRFRVLVVGDGPERATLERRAAGLGLDIEFTGALEGGSLEAVARRIDVAVMPSVWEETAGLAAMEAMRRGTPIIASAIGGLEETVGSGGVLVEPGSVEALAGAMRGLLEDPGRRGALGEEARRRADSAFTLERMIEEHAELWARAAAR